MANHVESNCYETSKFGVFELSFLFLAVSSCIAYKFSAEITQPYMDETFHVPQAQKYCMGTFDEWDEKITTPPGLYLISTGILTPISSVVGVKNVCSLVALRSINVFFALGNFYLMLAVHKQFHTPSTKFSAPLAVNLSILPTLYFFTFLYYTDAGSLFFILFTFLLSQHQSHTMAAFMALISLTFRQTNIIWVFFIALTHTKVLADDELKTFRWKSVIRFLWRTITTLWPYITVGVTFLLFLYWNNGIVLGDRSAHEACFHAPQFLYFLLFCAFFGFPYVFSIRKVRDFLKFCQKNFLLMVFVAGLCILSIHKFSYIHPYLLADNRHFPFYIWRKIFLRHWLLPYAFIPIYMYIAVTLIKQLENHDFIWKMIFFACVTISTVPHKLVEFRYFIIPYILLRLHAKPQESYVKLLIEFLINISINVVVFVLFFTRTFMWDSSNDVQRFMW